MGKSSVWIGDFYLKKFWKLNRDNLANLFPLLRSMYLFVYIFLCDPDSTIRKQISLLILLTHFHDFTIYFDPVWICICLVKLLDCVNFSSHISHLNGLDPV